MNNTKRRVSSPQLTKLTFLFTLLLGWGSQAWGDDIVFNGSTNTLNWTLTNGNGGSASYSSGDISSYGTTAYGLRIFTSPNDLSTSGKSVVINAKKYNTSSSGAYISIYTSSNNGSSWTDPETFDVNNGLGNNFADLSEVSIPEGTNKIKIECGLVYIHAITLKSGGDVSTPILSVDPTSHDFGDVTDNKDADFTINNTGTGSFGVTITKSGTDKDLFTITEGTVSGITSENAGGFTVSFNYGDVVTYGTKTATITVTPDYEGGEAQDITVTAYAKDPATWEDFSDGIPSSWYNENNSWTTTQTGYSGKANPGYNSAKILRSPRLYAEAGQTVSYDVIIGGDGSSYKIKAEYSTDRNTWNDIATYTSSNTYSFEAPTSGYYWLRFTGYNSALDNFVGFGPADATHELVLGNATIPASGIMYGDYTASVVVKELGGSGETVTAKLFFDGEEVAEKTGISIGANRDETVSVKFIPTSITTGQVYLKIIYNGDVELTTTPQDVTISETNKVISEDATDVPTGLSLTSSDVLKVKYTPKNGWSTICMPFGLWYFMEDIFGTGWKLYELSSYSDGVLNFSKTSTTSVSTPFLVYAENADPSKSVYYLRGVSLQSSNWTSLNINKEVEDGTSGATATFKGTFAPISAPNMNGKYGITNESKLAKGNTSASIPGYRAYLEFSEGAPAARIITIDGDEVATDLGFVKMVDPEAKDVYTLSGQKVLKASKGIYIVNGRKVVIK